LKKVKKSAFLWNFVRLFVVGGGGGGSAIYPRSSSWVCILTVTTRIEFEHTSETADEMSPITPLRTSFMNPVRFVIQLSSQLYANDHGKLPTEVAAHVPSAPENLMAVRRCIGLSWVGSGESDSANGLVG
jgi:hypothetical protein